MIKIYRYNNTIIQRDGKIGISELCCCTTTTPTTPTTPTIPTTTPTNPTTATPPIEKCFCEYIVQFPIDFTVSVQKLNGDPANLAGTLTGMSWFDENGNSLTLLGCTDWTDCNDPEKVVFGYLVIIKIDNEEFIGLVESQYAMDFAPCDEIKNLSGLKGCVTNSFLDKAGEIQFL